MRDYSVKEQGKPTRKIASGTWQQAEQIVKSVDPENQMVLFHAGTADEDESITMNGVLAQMGEWVEECLWGATDSEGAIEEIKNRGGAAYFSEATGWIKVKAERAKRKAEGGPYRIATLDDIRKYGQLTIVLADLDGPIHRYLGDEESLYPTYESLRGEKMTSDDLPFGLEPGDFFSEEDIAADITLTGDDLIKFMQRNYPQFSLGIDIPKELAKARPAGKTASGDARATGEYPLAGDQCSGLTVGEHVANMDSIGASFYEYEILDDIREVPMADFENREMSFTHTKNSIKALADQIMRNGRIDPLIVAVDDQSAAHGPYVLEGGHRFDALVLLGKPTFPALVVRDLSPDFVGGPETTFKEASSKATNVEPWQQTHAKADLSKHKEASLGRYMWLIDPRDSQIRITKAASDCRTHADWCAQLGIPPEKFDKMKRGDIKVNEDKRRVVIGSDDWSVYGIHSEKMWAPRDIIDYFKRKYPRFAGYEFYDEVLEKTAGTPKEARGTQPARKGGIAITAAGDWQKTQVIPEGTILYHGTSKEFDPSTVSVPGWFSTSEKTAEHYSWLSEGENRRVLKYRTVRPIRLPKVDDKAEMDSLSKMFGIDTASPEAIIHTAPASGIPGWIAADEIMLVSGKDIVPVDQGTKAASEWRPNPVANLEKNPEWLRSLSGTSDWLIDRKGDVYDANNAIHDIIARRIGYTGLEDALRKGGIRLKLAELGLEGWEDTIGEVGIEVRNMTARTRQWVQIIVRNLASKIRGRVFLDWGHGRQRAWTKGTPAEILRHVETPEPEDNAAAAKVAKQYGLVFPELEGKAAAGKAAAATEEPYPEWLAKQNPTRFPEELATCWTSIQNNRPYVAQGNLETAKELGFETTPDGKLVLYHGTISARQIMNSGALRAGSFLAADPLTAKRFSYAAGRKPQVIRIEVDPSLGFLRGDGYFTANEPIPVTEAAIVKEASGENLGRLAVSDKTAAEFQKQLLSFSESPLTPQSSVEV